MAKQSKSKIKFNYPSKIASTEIVGAFNELKSLRFVWDAHWREIADFHIPRKNDILRQQIPGSKKALDLYDNTAMHSSELLTSALHGLLTNPAAYFFDYTSGDPEIDYDDDCRAWMQDAMRKTHDVLNDSNFQTQIHEVYTDIVNFGTGPMTIEEDSRYVVRFKSWAVKNVYLDEDPQGEINRVYRYFKWNADKIVKRFGIENVSKVVLKSFEDRDINTMFEIIHAVYPKDEESNDLHNFLSQYVELETRKELDVGGFNEFPYITPRWNKIDEEMYGRSPAMTSLPEAKTINEMTKTTLIAAQKVIDPPLMIPDDGFIMPIKTKPGGFNYYRPGTDPIKPIFNQDIRLDLSDTEREATRKRIREAFYVDQLSLGTNNPQMTATEVNARQEQAMTLLGPMLGRLQSELLQPMILRVFNIMMRRGMFKPVPLKLKKHSRIVVQYSSLIAKAQRQVDIKAIQKYLDVLTPFTNADPTVMDNLDGDIAARLLLKLTGAPQEIIKDQNDVKQIRDARAKAQAKQAQQQDQQHQAEVASKALPAMATAQQAQQKMMGGIKGPASA
jgi:hypothetical protein